MHIICASEIVSLYTNKVQMCESCSKINDPWQKGVVMLYLFNKYIQTINKHKEHLKTFLVNMQILFKPKMKSIKKKS